MADRNSDSEALTVVIEKLTEICERNDVPNSTSNAAFVPAAISPRVSSIVVRNNLVGPTTRVSSIVVRNSGAFQKEVEVHKCDECDYSSQNKHYLKQHIDLVHSADRPYKCPFCDYAGKRSYALKEHLIVHSNERPFECSYCNATFRKKGHLTNHIKMHASRTTQCCFCEKNFNSLNELFAHIECYHANEQDKIYACGTCGFTSTDQLTMNTHIISQHPSESSDKEDISINVDCTDSQLNEFSSSSGSSDDVILKCIECGFKTESHVVIQKHILEHIMATEGKSIPSSTATAVAEIAKSSTSDPVIVSQKGLDTEESNATEIICNSQSLDTTNKVMMTVKLPPDMKCPHCSFISNHVQTFNEHVESHTQKLSVYAAASKTVCINSGNARFSFDESLGIFRCSICGYTCEYQRTIKSHVWKHSGHKDVDYPMFQNGPLSMYDEIRMTASSEVVAPKSGGQYRVFNFDPNAPNHESDENGITLAVPIIPPVVDSEKTEVIMERSIENISQSLPEAALNNQFIIIVENDSKQPPLSTASDGIENCLQEKKDFSLICNTDERQLPSLKRVCEDGFQDENDYKKPCILFMKEEDENVQVNAVAEIVDDTCPLIAVKPEPYSLSNNSTPLASDSGPNSVISDDVDVAEVVIACEKRSADADCKLNIEQVANKQEVEKFTDDTDGLVVEAPRFMKTDNAPSKNVQPNKRVLRSSSNTKPSVKSKTDNAEKKNSKSGICSSLLAVIEQLRERSQSETDNSTSKDLKTYDQEVAGVTIDALATTKPVNKVPRQRRNRNKHSVVDDGVPVESLANVEVLSDGHIMRCQLCHYQSASVALIKQHMRLHKSKQPFECSLCDHIAESSENLQDHMLQHCKVRTYKCTLCPGNFNYKSQLRAHMRAHNEQEPFSCDICGSESKNPIAFRNHMRSHTCVTCNDVYKSSCEQKKHSRAFVQSDGVLRCDDCPFTATSEDELSKHQQSHVKLFKCEQCEFTCSTLGSIRNHCRTHVQEKVMQCSLCDFAATSIRSLKSHMKRHVNDQRYVQQPLEQYKCNLCGYVCHHLPSLKSHMWRHSSERTYSYQQANNIINAAIDFDNHARSIEPIISTEKILDDNTVIAAASSDSSSVLMNGHPLVTFRCCQCGFESTNRANLAAHMKDHVDIIAQTLNISQTIKRIVTADAEN